MLFDVKPAIPVKLTVPDFDGKPTVGPVHLHRRGRPRLPAAGQAARRPTSSSRSRSTGPTAASCCCRPASSRWSTAAGRSTGCSEAQKVNGRRQGRADARDVKLERWVEPADYGWYSGDHHIHAAGCAHYTSPTEGVMPEDMFLHVKGEGLNVGCCLTWGPCYDYQRQFFEPTPHKLSEPFTVLKYDVEVSGLRLAGARPRLPAEPPRPDLPRLGGDQDQGLADVDHAAHALGQGPGRRHRLRPLGQRPEIDRRRRREAAARRSTRTRTAASRRTRPPPAAAARAVRQIDADGDGKLDATELLAQHKRAPTCCRTWRSRR